MLISIGIGWLDREGAAVLGVDARRPPGTATKLDIDAIIEFGEFGCGNWDAWWLVLSTCVLCGRRTSDVSVVVSGGIPLIIIIIIVHGGQVQGVSKRPLKNPANHLSSTSSS